MFVLRPTAACLSPYINLAAVLDRLPLNNNELGSSLCDTLVKGSSTAFIRIFLIASLSLVSLNLLYNLAPPADFSVANLPCLPRSISTSS